MPESLTTLLDADAASQLTRVSAARLVELADAGMAPCVRIDGGQPFFLRKDIISWVKDHLVEVQSGRSIGDPIVVRAKDYGPPKWADLPDALKPMLDHLSEFHDALFPPCVYFLVLDREVVYVGQSVSVPSRLVQHRKDKKFDRVYVLPCAQSELNEVEAAFIRILKPSLNGNAGPMAKEIELSHVIERLTLVKTIEAESVC